MAGQDDEFRQDCPQCREELANLGRSEGEGQGDGDDAWNREVRGETPLQREDRRYSELLQEVRVAQTGVQILLAFLLTVAFSPRFSSLQPQHRTIYLVTLLLGAGATALLIAPVAIHRLIFGRRLKPQLVRVANLLTIWGLTLLMLTIGSALLLIFDLILGLGEALVLTAAVLAWFIGWWYVLPAVMRARQPPLSEARPATGEHRHDPEGNDGRLGQHRHPDRPAGQHRHPDGGQDRPEDRSAHRSTDRSTGRGTDEPHRAATREAG